MKTKTPQRGRPKGSKNKKKIVKKVKKTIAPVKKNRGRPSLSKDKKPQKLKKNKKEIKLNKKPKNSLNIEIWKVEDSVYKIYAENKELIEKLGKALKTKICATYMRNGKDFGWDMFFDKQDLSYVKQVCKNIV